MTDETRFAAADRLAEIARQEMSKGFYATPGDLTGLTTKGYAVAEAFIAELRSDPALAADVLGGSVQRRRIDRDGALVGEYLAKIDGDRDEVRVTGPWVEVQP